MTNSTRTRIELARTRVKYEGPASRVLIISVAVAIAYIAICFGSSFVLIALGHYGVIGNG